uniref:Uncharacterized protein n=1 Tax=Knipowitschia caucasica TaxID=637954 RepID=A0AAV2JL59_KNICA
MSAAGAPRATDGAGGHTDGAGVSLMGLGVTLMELGHTDGAGSDNSAFGQKDLVLKWSWLFMFLSSSNLPISAEPACHQPTGHTACDDCRHSDQRDSEGLRVTSVTDRRAWLSSWVAPWGTSDRTRGQ